MSGTLFLAGTFLSCLGYLITIDKSCRPEVGWTSLTMGVGLIGLAVATWIWRMP
ncbi:MAG: hypothetical protein FD152_539 [Xanthobacteraceae bacterium]|nr:MAG: hypothetical protein FD152_539 [Xanthobacteraceae bacterium]